MDWFNCSEQNREIFISDWSSFIVTLHKIEGIEYQIKIDFKYFNFQIFNGFYADNKEQALIIAPRITLELLTAVLDMVKMEDRERVSIIESCLKIQKGSIL